MTTQEAKQIRIADYLQSLGYTPVKQQGNSLWYKSPFRQETEASFKVNTDRNLWFDYGLGRGGNIIALAQELYASDHVPYLLQDSGTGSTHPSRVFLLSPAGIRAEFLQRLYRTEGHQPYPATGRAEREMPRVRGHDGLSFLPHVADEELSGHAQP